MSWGRILVGTRLGKGVPATFVVRWSEIITRGLSPGDGFAIERGKVAHKAANDLVRLFLSSDADSLLFIDDDAVVPVDVLEQFRALPGADQYDAVQAFYTRRGWPPMPIWIQEDPLGVTMDTFVDNREYTDPVAIVGLHCTIIRRRVFEKMLGQNDPAKFEWFWYPRHEEASEDGAFSMEAVKLHGFKFAATTHIKTDHICELQIGWDMYRQWMQITGRDRLVSRYRMLAHLIGEFIGEDDALVVAKSMRAGGLIADKWRDEQPVTEADFDAFYEATGHLYIYDLLRWNCEPLYQRIIDPLAKVHNARCLVFGAGIGTEVNELLRNDSNKVDAVEISPTLREFLRSNVNDARVSIAPSIDQLCPVTGGYDVLVAIDVLEHLHPEAITAYLRRFDELLNSNGLLVMHYATDRHDGFPQHVDNDRAVTDWLENGYERMGEFLWRKK